MRRIWLIAVRDGRFRKARRIGGSGGATWMRSERLCDPASARRERVGGQASLQELSNDEEHTRTNAQFHWRCLKRLMS